MANLSEKIPITLESSLVCPVCFNLDADLCPIYPLLDQPRITAAYSDLKHSAETSTCQACKILILGLEDIDESWGADQAESENGDRILLDGTRLVIDIRRGHSLLVTLSNVGYEMTIEFYTLNPEGIIAFS